MQNTFNNNNQSIWIKKQKVFINALKEQKIIVVLRINESILIDKESKHKFLQKIRKINDAGIKNIEIGWFPHEGWPLLITEILANFPNIYLGAASITNREALKAVIEVGLAYSMSPIWDEDLQEEARQKNQLLIPGVFSPTEIQRAKSFGWRIVKLFPASTLGIDYIQKLHISLKPLPFIIAAGGINPKECSKWLIAGHGAIAIGREIKTDKELDLLVNI
ncbi:bifunctional 4-hydroxy-2-oxoglutarate aldolase/2-dehydro-3-deoxy-phosphogluconate aldolase [Prochlorococcus sp. MIT 1223]|uniref:bifunctional 4-hydroxy-2-oxoglutarate aldolase/2-dehydro-3-deoxy-phosphogluconate aldolase n=1 Tax=Prochlorococcus sp. MIT 1223 TaxID=3096217 RepID=UPI002A753FC3|nr:bifunctional 4-hydroxy-2-oxoglutarate aldolase/2-dehydro-3-deoxy-phosphogluconate aldolase [Prochlorococcus sp. MIT 1223]